MMPQPIDIAAMKKQELTLMNQKIAFKETSREDLFNMLQDLRHIILFDVRAKPGENHIRDSNFIADFVGKSKVVSFSKVFDLYNTKFEMNEAKYKTKRIRRLCIIDDAANKYEEEKNPNQKILMDAVRDYRDFNKVFYLKGGFEAFESKYPFLCLNFNEREKVQEKKPEKDGEFDEYTKKLMYSFSRFPFEIIPDKLYLGGIINANSTKQCKDLGIKTLIDLNQYDEPVESIKDKTKDFTYENIPLAENIIDVLDLDEICAHVETLLSKEDSRPVLIFCKDGEIFSPGLVIAYFMYTKKMKIDMASLSVFQKISNVNLNPKFYSLLQVYEPKKFVDASSDNKQ